MEGFGAGSELIAVESGIRSGLQNQRRLEGYLILAVGALIAVEGLAAVVESGLITGRLIDFGSCS